MFGIKAYREERKRVKENWEEIKLCNQEKLDNYKPEYRYYAECLNKYPVENKILYEPKARLDRLEVMTGLFDAFLKRDDFTKYRHIWVLHKVKPYQIVKKAYKQYKNVEIWLLKEEEELPEKYYHLLATASYIVQAGLFPSCFVKRKEQFYLKLQQFSDERPVGYEEGGNRFRAGRHMQNLLAADMILTANEADGARLKSAFRLEEIYEGMFVTADTNMQGKEIWETVIDKKDSVKAEERRRTDKKKILIHGSGLAVNGMTEALLALLKNIDYSKYDVTVLCWIKDGIYSFRNMDRIDARARALMIHGTDPVTRDEQLALAYLKKYGLRGREEKKLYRKNRYLLQRAAFHRLGNVSFDYAIDFVGYAVWTPMLFLEIPAKKRLIWQHNDLKEDFNVCNTDGVKHKNTSLPGLLSLYLEFDKIVSVNEALMKINRQKLAVPETEKRFTYVTNLLDKERLEKRISEAERSALLQDAEGTKYLVFDNERTSVDGIIKMFPCKKQKGQYDFVTMGRLSAEKNHRNLILAFQEFLAEYPESRLFIIGKGILLEELQSLVVKNGLENRVFFTGGLTNPYILMKNCDCFVFPSYFEGQGLVVLEARMLHMPIVMSDYGVAESVCMENGQYMTGTQKEDILKGLLAYANGEVPADYQFDIDAYNKKALEEFYRVLED